MKNWIGFIGVAAALLAGGPARAQDNNALAAYEAKLAAKPATPAVRAYCNAKLGAESGYNQAEYRSCRITRFLVADASSNSIPGLPPSAKPDYMSDPEMKTVVDAISN